MKSKEINHLLIRQLQLWAAGIIGLVALHLFITYFYFNLLDIWTRLHLPGRFESVTTAINWLNTKRGFVLSGWGIAGLGLVFSMLMISRPGWAPQSNKAITGCMVFARYALAYVMISYAFYKIPGRQFRYTYLAVDTPAGQIADGYFLWYLFGKSFAFTLTAALFEMIPALLLLNRRFYLLGALLMMPVLVFINIIDWYYYIGPDIRIYSTALLLLLLAVLCFDIKRIRTMIAGLLIPKRRSWRFPPLYHGAPVLFLITFVLYAWCFLPDAAPAKKPFGGYQIERVVVDGKAVMPDTSALAWARKIYIEQAWGNTAKKADGTVINVAIKWSPDSIRIMPEPGYAGKPDAPAAYDLAYRYSEQKKELVLTGIVNSMPVSYYYKKLPLEAQHFWPYTTE